MQYLLCAYVSGKMSWCSEPLLAEVVAQSTDINSLVMIRGRQVSQLMAACAHGNIDYVRDLLEAPGVKIDLQSSKGQHALLFACEQGHTEIAQFILHVCKYPTDH